MEADTRTDTDIASLLVDLPPESLRMVEQFVLFLCEQVHRGQPVMAVEQEKQPFYMYPTVAVPASSFDKLIGIMPPMGGDALEDSEALYNEI